MPNIWKEPLLIHQTSDEPDEFERQRGESAAEDLVIFLRGLFFLMPCIANVLATDHDTYSTTVGTVAAAGRTAS